MGDTVCSVRHQGVTCGTFSGRESMIWAYTCTGVFIWRRTSTSFSRRFQNSTSCAVSARRTALSGTSPSSQAWMSAMAVPPARGTSRSLTGRTGAGASPRVRAGSSGRESLGSRLSSIRRIFPQEEPEVIRVLGARAFLVPRPSWTTAPPSLHRSVLPRAS